MGGIDRRIEKIERKLEDGKERRLVVLFGDDRVPAGELRPHIVHFDEEDRDL